MIETESQNSAPISWVSVAGWMMVVSGVLHLMLWPVVGGSWEGPLSIRKPILFGVSTGVTMISLAWILKKMPQQKYDAAVGVLFSAALLVEVGLITVQFWRGEASHFNHASTIGYAIDIGISILVSLGAIVIVDVARRSFGPLSVAPEMVFAIRSGLVYLVISCALGFFILFYGEYLLSINRRPEIFGEAGVMKFPHGVAIHAIQFFPALVWIAQRLDIGSGRRGKVVLFADAAMGAFLIFSLLQTFGGRARFELGLTSGIFLAAAICLCLPVLWIFGSAILKLFSNRMIGPDAQLK